MGVIEIIVAVLSVAGAIIFSAWKVERGKRKAVEKEVEVKKQVIDELESEALNLNQRAESAQALQEIEHDRRKKDDKAKSTISNSGRKPLGRLHDDTR